MQQELIIIDPVILSFAVAPGISLLIGAEREHRKGEGPNAPAIGNTHLHNRANSAPA